MALIMGGGPFSGLTSISRTTSPRVPWLVALDKLSRYFLAYQPKVPNPMSFQASIST
jgi:hypothetical protein